MGDDLIPVLVTGASGYLGGSVLEMLRREGVNVIGVSRNAPGTISCNLTDTSAVQALLRENSASYRGALCSERTPQSRGLS